MIPYMMYNDNVQLRAELERFRKEREEALRAAAQRQQQQQID
jgi:hypothetical protein